MAIIGGEECQDNNGNEQINPITIAKALTNTITTTIPHIK